MTSTRIASAREVFLNNSPFTADERPELEASFFKSIAARNGTHKTTVSARLCDVDQRICEKLKHVDAVHILEVGLSSGVTTLELLESLEAAGVRTSGWGVDICIHARLCSLLGTDVLYDSSGRVIQLATPWFTRGKPHRSQCSLPSRLLGFLFKFFELFPIRKGIEYTSRSHCVELVSRRLLKSRNFRVREFDISHSAPEWRESFDLIRAANILNLDYFLESEILSMVHNLTSWLKPGAILVLCRTHNDGSNHGGFYQRQLDRPTLHRVGSFGEGYELDHRLDEAMNRGHRSYSRL